MSMSTNHSIPRPKTRIALGAPAVLSNASATNRPLYLVQSGRSVVAQITETGVVSSSRRYIDGVKSICTAKDGTMFAVTNAGASSFEAAERGTLEILDRDGNPSALDQTAVRQMIAGARTHSVCFHEASQSLILLLSRDEKKSIERFSFATSTAATMALKPWRVADKVTRFAASLVVAQRGLVISNSPAIGYVVVVEEPGASALSASACSICVRNVSDGRFLRRWRLPDAALLGTLNVALDASEQAVLAPLHLEGAIAAFGIMTGAVLWRVSMGPGLRPTSIAIWGKGEYYVTCERDGDVAPSSSRTAGAGAAAAFRTAATADATVAAGSEAQEQAQEGQQGQEQQQGTENAADDEEAELNSSLHQVVVLEDPSTVTPYGKLMRDVRAAGKGKAAFKAAVKAFCASEPSVIISDCADDPLLQSRACMHALASWAQASGEFFDADATSNSTMLLDDEGGSFRGSQNSALDETGVRLFASVTSKQQLVDQLSAVAHATGDASELRKLDFDAAAAVEESVRRFTARIHGPAVSVDKFGDIMQAVIGDLARHHGLVSRLDLRITSLSVRRGVELEYSMDSSAASNRSAPPAGDASAFPDLAQLLDDDSSDEISFMVDARPVGSSSAVGQAMMAQFAAACHVQIPGLEPAEILAQFEKSFEKKGEKAPPIALRQIQPPGTFEIIGPPTARNAFMAFICTMQTEHMMVPSTVRTAGFSPSDSIMLRSSFTRVAVTPAVYEHHLRSLFAAAAEHISKTFPFDSISIRRFDINPELLTSCPCTVNFFFGASACGLDLNDETITLPDKGLFAWHATPTADGIKGICHSNMDPLRRRRNVLGKGESFAENATYSISGGYAGRTNTVILFFILTCKGSPFSSHCRPPNRIFVVNNIQIPDSDENIMFQIPVATITTLRMTSSTAESGGGGSANTTINSRNSFSRSNASPSPTRMTMSSSLRSQPGGAGSSSFKPTAEEPEYIDPRCNGRHVDSTPRASPAASPTSTALRPLPPLMANGAVDDAGATGKQASPAGSAASQGPAAGAAGANRDASPAPSTKNNIDNNNSNKPGDQQTSPGQREASPLPQDQQKQPSTTNPNRSGGGEPSAANGGDDAALGAADASGKRAGGGSKVGSKGSSSSCCFCC